MRSFINEIKTEHFYFKHALGKSELHGEEFHEHDEIVFCLSNGVRLLSKNVQLDLPFPCIVFIPREHFHHFTYKDEDSYLRCILHYKGQGEIMELMRSVCDEVKVVLLPGTHSTELFMHLMKCAERGISEEDGELLLRAAFTALLVDEKLFGKSAAKGASISDLTRSAIEFIDENYAMPITLEDIAASIGVSVSTLSHVFSRELSLSVHKYVTEKRFSSVRAQLAEGASLGDAALRSGFSDYSAFFRLYKKRYGEIPSQRLARDRAER